MKKAAYTALVAQGSRSGFHAESTQTFAQTAASATMLAEATWNLRTLALFRNVAIDVPAASKQVQIAKPASRTMPAPGCPGANTPSRCSCETMIRGVTSRAPPSASAVLKRSVLATQAWLPVASAERYMGHSGAQTSDRAIGTIEKSRWTTA